MKTLLFLMLLAGIAWAAPDFVVYEKVTGAIVSYDKQYDLDKSRLTADGHGFKGWMSTNILGICSTTNEVAGKTNISQLVVTIIDPSDHAADVTQWDPRLKQAVLGLLDCMNARLPADKKIGLAELKAAIKARGVAEVKP